MQTAVYLRPINLESVGGSSTSSSEMSDQGLIILLYLEDEMPNSWVRLEHWSSVLVSWEKAGYVWLNEQLMSEKDFYKDSVESRDVKGHKLIRLPVPFS